MQEQQRLELEFDHGDLCDVLLTLVGIAVLLPPAVDEDDVGGPGVFVPDLCGVVLHQSSDENERVVNCAGILQVDHADLHCPSLQSHPCVMIYHQ